MIIEQLVSEIVGRRTSCTPQRFEQVVPPFCETTFQGGDLADRASVVIQETLENAVKYSTEGDAAELELRIESHGEQIEFSVASLPDPLHLSTLKDELSSIATQTANICSWEVDLRTRRFLWADNPIRTVNGVQDLSGDLDRFFHIPGFDKYKSSQHLLGLRERTVCD